LVYQIAFITAFQAVIVAFALGIYLAFSRILKPQNLFRTLMVVVFVLASSNVAITFLGVIPSIMRLWRPLGWVLVSTPTIVTLLFGMWRADLDRTSRPIAT